jgi:MarR family transcriptional regulator, organic hydroperoxide resistance regulator
MKPAGPHGCDAWRLLVQLSLSQRGHLPSLAAEFELSPAQCHVLHLIEPGRPVPMGEVAGALSCDASNVTGLVDRLEARGLVARQPSPADRRVKVLTLTAAGRRVRAVLIARLTSPPDTLGRLSAQEQRLLVDLLRRILE